MRRRVRIARQGRRMTRTSCCIEAELHGWEDATMMSKRWAAALGTVLGLSVPAVAQQSSYDIPVPRSKRRLRSVDRSLLPAWAGRCRWRLRPRSPPHPRLEQPRVEPFALLGTPPEARLAQVSYLEPGGSLPQGQTSQNWTSLSGPPPVPPPDDGMAAILPPEAYGSTAPVDRPLKKGFWDKCHDWFGSPAAFFDGQRSLVPERSLLRPGGHHLAPLEPVPLRRSAP